MSTRGWYEYYVLNEEVKQIALSMQFYKWGDAIPENAVAELIHFKRILAEHDGQLPIFLLDDMLREQLGAAYEQLPESFSIGCYFFFLQRATEELSFLINLRYSRMPREERPDYQYGYAIGYAMAVQGLPARNYDNRFVRLANDFVVAGKCVRPWNRYSLKYSVLTWLQYLTQPTKEIDMGSIASSFSTRFDVSYLYRFFIFTSRADLKQPILDVRLQMCDRVGDDLLVERKDEGIGGDESNEYEEEREELKELLEKASEKPYSLAEALKSYEMVPNDFWRSND